MGPLAPTFLRNSIFTTQANEKLLKPSRFLPRDALLKFSFSVILPSIMYGLVLWVACCNSDIISSIERLDCRADRIIFDSHKDMASSQILNFANWITSD